MQSVYPYLLRGRVCKDIRFDFLVCDDTAAAWYGGEKYEFTEAVWLRENVRRGFHVIDCGSHHGCMTMVMALAAAPGVVTAYEALPRNARIVELNAQLNGLGNVEVRPMGVGDTDGRFVVSQNDGNSIVSTTRDTGSESDDVIDVVRIDSDYGDRPVDLLKLDVEGGELRALNGARRILARRPRLCIELHNFMMDNPSDHVNAVVAALPSSGYKWQIVDGMWDAATPSGDVIDIQKLAMMNNPHLFGVPT